jgi:hypothetical protein
MAVTYAGKTLQMTAQGDSFSQRVAIQSIILSDSANAVAALQATSGSTNAIVLRQLAGKTKCVTFDPSIVVPGLALSVLTGTTPVVTIVLE